MEAKQVHRQWLLSKHISARDKAVLKTMIPAEINAAFGKQIKFGTAGIRAHMGIGTSLLNTHTIKMVTYAWIKSLELADAEALKKPLVVGHDVRKNGFHFANTVAQVISGMGYPVVMFHNNNPVPTPLISFTIRNLNLGGGACITASHNPPQYNGFKCFTKYGQHLMPNESGAIQSILAKTSVDMHIPMSKTNIKYLEASYENYYLENVIKCLGMKEKTGENLKIVFSPQHGASYKLGPQILRKLGFDVIKAPLQSIPDESFSHTPDPNPENPLAFNEMIETGKKNKAPLLLSTDPDGDRVAIGVWHQNEYVLLNGQEMAAIITYHLLKQRSQKKIITRNDHIVKSIVTTTLIDKICKANKVRVKKTLTGFKYLGEVIRTAKINTLLAIEESYGASLCPRLSLDKDALQVLPFVAVMTSHYLTKGMTLVDVLEHIYKKHGYYILKNHKLKIDSNARQLNKTFNKLKKTSMIGGFAVKKVHDFESGVAGFAKTQMLIITFASDSWIALRPSGTEPLIRLYFNISDKFKKEAISRYEKIRRHLLEIIGA